MRAMRHAVPGCGSRGGGRGDGFQLAGRTRAARTSHRRDARGWGWETRRRRSQRHPAARGAVGADDISAAAAKARAPPPPPPRPPSRRREQGDVYEQVVAYCEGIQRLVHAQCVALATDFGVRLHHWFPYLRATGLLDLDFSDRPYLVPKKRSARSEFDPGRERTRTRTPTQAHAQTRRGRGGAGGGGGGGGAVGADGDFFSGGRMEEAAMKKATTTSTKKRPRDVHVAVAAVKAPREASSAKGLRKLTTMTTTSTAMRHPSGPRERLLTAHLPLRGFAVGVDLAALWARAPVHPGDIVRWALDGDLPYLGESARVRAYTTAKRQRQPQPQRSAGSGGGGGGGRGGGRGGRTRRRAAAISSSFQRRLPFKNALSARRCLKRIRWRRRRRTWRSKWTGISATATPRRFSSDACAAPPLQQLRGCAHRPACMAPGLRHGGSLGPVVAAAGRVGVVSRR